MIADLVASMSALSFGSPPPPPPPPPPPSCVQSPFIFATPRELALPLVANGASKPNRYEHFGFFTCWRQVESVELIKLEGNILFALSFRAESR